MSFGFLRARNKSRATQIDRTTPTMMPRIICRFNLPPIIKIRQSTTHCQFQICALCLSTACRLAHTIHTLFADWTATGLCCVVIQERCLACNRDDHGRTSYGSVGWKSTGCTDARFHIVYPIPGANFGDPYFVLPDEGLRSQAAKEFIRITGISYGIQTNHALSNLPQLEG